MRSASPTVRRWRWPGYGNAGRTRKTATLHSFTVITGPANELVAPIHNRMPVVLPREFWRRWLGEERTETDELQALLRPYPAEAMRAYPVAARVGNVRNNDPELLIPVAA